MWLRMFATSRRLIFCAALGATLVAGSAAPKKSITKGRPTPAAATNPAPAAPLLQFTAPPPPSQDEPAASYPRPPSNWLEVQVELARRAFSGGSIDGLRGPQSLAALRAFQRSEDIPETGELDDETADALQLTAPALLTVTITAEELATLQPLATTWLGKSEQTTLAHETALELAAERSHASPNLLKRLNPEIDWTAVTPDTPLVLPHVGRIGIAGKAAKLHIGLAAHELEATDENDHVIAHFPVSIAKHVEKRPVGELHVTVIAPDPNYTFDPAVFPESEEAQTLGRKLILPPGPNNPVGAAWIGLDRPGYGMHGTPEPEKVGRTESHGCFRLANWDARTLLDLAWVGLPVEVEP